VLLLSLDFMLWLLLTTKNVQAHPTLVGCIIKLIIILFSAIRKSITVKNTTRGFAILMFENK